MDKYNALELNSAYRIKGFGCQITEKWQQTLDSKFTLLFGRLTNLSHVPADNFPEHYFRFAAYNEVTGRADTNQFLLTGIHFNNYLRSKLNQQKTFAGEFVSAYIWTY